MKKGKKKREKKLKKLLCFLDVGVFVLLKTIGGGKLKGKNNNNNE